MTAGVTVRSISARPYTAAAAAATAVQSINKSSTFTHTHTHTLLEQRPSVSRNRQPNKHMTIVSPET